MSSSYAERERERGEKGGEAELAAAFDHCSLCQVYSVNTDFTQPVLYIYIYIYICVCVCCDLV